MKVLFLATRDIRHPAAAGGDIQMWEYARFLASRGHTVTFLASSYPDAARQERIDGVEIVRVGGVHWLWLRTFVYYMRAGRGRYDLVVAEGFGGSRIPRLAPLYVREPMLTEWHQVHGDLFASQFPRPLVPVLNVLERLTARVHRNTLVRAGTADWREAFASLGFKPENIVVVPVSISEDWLALGTPRRVSEPRIVWLGKFRRYKCPHHAIRALKLVADRGSAATLTLAGRHDDRRYESSLRRLAGSLGLAERVDFRFDISESEKRNLLLGARLLVLPSSVEGFGIVVLEANACGVPVVASSGVPQGAVQHGFNGLRYPFGDIDALAAATTDLLADDALHARLSANARTFAQRFSWPAVGAEFERVVAAAVGNGAGPSDERKVS
jgi:glycosyltransferase involved in cell wall biosynthesis